MEDAGANSNPNDTAPRQSELVPPLSAIVTVTPPAAPAPFLVIPRTSVTSIGSQQSTSTAASPRPSTASVAAYHQNYIACLNKLFWRHQITKGLQNSKKLSHLLEYPYRDYQTVHIAGTNGKGSVALKIANCLQQHSVHTAEGVMPAVVGLFTSPHLFTIRERIRVNNQLITEEEFVELANRILETADEHNLNVSFFEICTQIAFSYFRSKKCTWAVIETGMGGRWDATNVLESPKACVITSIGWDHMKVLGNDLRKIAFEKAGIIKRGQPLVIGPLVGQFAVIRERAEKMDAEVFEVAMDPRGLTIDEDHNRIVTKTIQNALKLDITQYRIDQALTIKQPFRMQCLTPAQVAMVYSLAAAFLQDMSQTAPTGDAQSSQVYRQCAIVLDVGHNESAIDRCCRQLGYWFYRKPIRVIVCLSTDRGAEVLQPVINHFSMPKDNRLLGMHYVDINHHRLKTVADIKAEITATQDSPQTGEKLRVSEELRDVLLDGIRQAHTWTEDHSEARCKGESSSEASRSPTSKVQEAPGANGNSAARTSYPNLRSIVSPVTSRIIYSAIKRCVEEGNVLLICGSVFMFKALAVDLLNIYVGPVDEIEMNEPKVTHDNGSIIAEDQRATSADTA